MTTLTGAVDLARLLDPSRAAKLAVRRLSDPRRVIPHIEARVQKTSKDKKRGQLIAYLPGRIVAAVLDDVIGPTRYRFEVLREPEFLGGSAVVLTCRGRLTIALPDGTETFRDDVGTGKLRVEDDGRPIADSVDAGYKGSVTDAFKRCAAAFGVGRCLYQIPEDPADKWRDWVDLDEYRVPLPAAKARVIRLWQDALLASLSIPVAAAAARTVQTGAASDENDQGGEPTDADAERRDQDREAEGETRQVDREDHDDTSTPEERAAGADAGDRTPPRRSSRATPAAVDGDKVAARNASAGTWEVDGVRVSGDQLRTVVAHCRLSGPSDLADDATWSWVTSCLDAVVRGETFPDDPRSAPAAAQEPAQRAAAASGGEDPPKPARAARGRESAPRTVAAGNAGKPMTEAQARLLRILVDRLGEDVVREAANGQDWDARVDVLDAKGEIAHDEHGEIVTEYEMRRGFASALISTLQQEAAATA